MKKIMLLFILTSFWACQEPAPSHTDLYLYLDYTEGQQYEFGEEEVNQFLQLMNIQDGTSRNAGVLRIYPLYDLASSRNVRIPIKEGKSKLESNKFVREKELKKFSEKVKSKVEEMNAAYGGEELKHSYIFQPLEKGFKKLTNSSADHKVVLIYSDMLENSQVANFHTAKLDEGALLKRLEQASNLEDLSEFEVYIVYPVDQKNDAKIQKRLAVWEQYFVNKGLDSEQFHADTGIDQ